MGPNENYLHRLWPERGGYFAYFLKFENRRLFVLLFGKRPREGRREGLKKKGVTGVVVIIFIIFIVIRGGVIMWAVSNFQKGVLLPT